VIHLAQLRSIVGAYQKNNITALPLTEDGVHRAIERAIELDRDDQVLPTNPVTRVYKLLELLLQRDTISLHVAVE